MHVIPVQTAVKHASMLSTSVTEKSTVVASTVVLDLGSSDESY